jgi:hypothetical protein
MRFVAFILGTFLALFGLVFGGCALGFTTAALWGGRVNGGLVWLVVVNVGLAAGLLQASYRLFRGPVRPPDGPAAPPPLPARRDTSPDP